MLTCEQVLTRLHHQSNKESKGRAIINLPVGKLHLAPVSYKHQEIKSSLSLSILTPIYPRLPSTKPIEASRHQGAQTEVDIPGGGSNNRQSAVSDTEH